MMFYLTHSVVKSDSLAVFGYSFEIFPALRQTLGYAKNLQRATTNNISRYFAKACPMRTPLEQNKNLLS